MQSTHDLLTRWPALNIAARRDRLHGSFQFSPGPLAQLTSAHTAVAERVAVEIAVSRTFRMEQRCRRAAGNREPARMVDLALPDGRIAAAAAGVRRGRQARWVHRRRAAGNGRIESRGRSPASNARRRAWVAASAHARFDRPGDGTGSFDTTRSHVLHFHQQVGNHDRAERVCGAFPARPARVGRPLHCDHRAITDEGTELAARARVERFREIFINPGDIGGRYSALSFLGLVPAALMGQEMAALVGWGARPCSQRRSPALAARRRTRAVCERRHA